MWHRHHRDRRSLFGWGRAGERQPVTRAQWGRADGRRHQRPGTRPRPSRARTRARTRSQPRLRHRRRRRRRRRQGHGRRHRAGGRAAPASATGARAIGRGMHAYRGWRVGHAALGRRWHKQPRRGCANGRGGCVAWFTRGVGTWRTQDIHTHDERVHETEGTDGRASDEAGGVRCMTKRQASMCRVATSGRKERSQCGHATGSALAPAADGKARACACGS